MVAPGCDARPERTAAVVTVLEKIGKVVFRPSAETGANVAAQVRRVPCVQQCSGEVTRAAVVERLFLPGEAARGVAGAAMAKPLHQIGAAIPVGIAVAFGDIAAARGENKIPDRKRPTETQE